MKCKVSDCFNCPYPDCINDYVAPYYPLSDECKERANERHRSLYQSRKDSGVCVRCGMHPPEQGRVRCSLCLNDDRKKHEKNSRKKGRTPRQLMNGVDLCKQCGKAKPVEGYKMCETCLEKARERAAIMLSLKKGKNAFEKGNKAYWERKKAKAHKETGGNNGTDE